MLRNTRQHFHTITGDNFKEQNLPQKYKHEKLSRLRERHLLTVRAETKRQNIVLFDLSREQARGQLQCSAALHMSENDHESTMSTDLRLQINVSEKVNSQLQNPGIMSVSYKSSLCLFALGHCIPLPEEGRAS